MNYKSKSSEPTLRKGRGRPRLKDEARRTRQIGVSVNLEEEETIDARAGRYHLTSAAYLRRLGMGHRLPRPIPAINYEDHQSLAAMAGDLSVLSEGAKAGQVVGVSGEFLARVYDLLQRVRLALLTGGADGDHQVN